MGRKRTGYFYEHRRFLFVLVFEICFYYIRFSNFFSKGNDRPKSRKTSLIEGTPDARHCHDYALLRYKIYFIAFKHFVRRLEGTLSSG